MRTLFSALAMLAAACSLGAGRAYAATASLGPDPWAGEWAGAARAAAGRLRDTTVRIDAAGAAELRTPGCAETLTFVRWGVPGRVYRGAGQCGPAETVRLVIGSDGVMRMRSVARGPQSIFYGALRARENEQKGEAQLEAPFVEPAAQPATAAVAAGPVAPPTAALGLLSLPAAAPPPPQQTPSGPLGESDLLGGPGSRPGSRSQAAPGASQP